MVSLVGTTLENEKMSGSLKLGLIIIGAVLGIKLVMVIVGSLWSWVMPLAIVAGIGLIVFGLVSRKALTGGRRRYLP